MVSLDGPHRVLSFALACAGQAGDWHRADRLTATGQAMLHADRGHALAKMHRVSETLTAIGTAEDHFAHSTPANDPPYMACYTALDAAGAIRSRQVTDDPA